MSEQRGCCTACEGTGTVATGYPCEDCYATGHCHPDPESCTDPERAVGVQSAGVAYTPPKYGPPPGVNPVKWKAMSRSDRRAHLRELARTMNRVAHQPEGE